MTSSKDVDFDRSGNRLGHLYEARSENDTVRKMVYLYVCLVKSRAEQTDWLANIDMG
jgi:hypothetical protein